LKFWNLGGSEAKSQNMQNELVAISPVDGYLQNGYTGIL
jgi:hypothetical protein